MNDRLLYIDMVPATAWYSNLRHALSETDWNIIKRHIYRKAGYRCEVCGDQGSQHPVEAHERWLFDLNGKLQVLADIEALCPNCHESTHYGLACVNGRAEPALRHLMFVNKWSENKAFRHAQIAKADHTKASTVRGWRLDISILAELPLTLSKNAQDIVRNHEQIACKKPIAFWKEVAIQNSKRLIPD